ncbi:site-specific DNA-methyltransferase [Kinneretia asaccharophila]|nr:site-specific DNA-methyltransferase [Roseateles asaccharophilus]MDN3544041.1 site-specific DNA-methyltransferase [Roseateles asaccharophilus]
MSLTTTEHIDYETGTGKGSVTTHSAAPAKKGLGAKAKALVPPKFFCERDGAKASLLLGDSLSVLKTLPSDVFNVAVTSPPYFWARDYGYEGQIGHEDELVEYVNALANIFDEVKRTLHPEGVFFLNIGDTFYSGNGQPHGQDPRCSSRQFMRKKLRAVDKSGWDIPKKSMIGVPWKLAFEMQSRGWTLRSDIIWNRCNAFSEPTARDRPHRQYEHLFMFTKSRFYSFDRSALPEEDVWNIPIERNVRIDHNAAFPSELVKRCVEAASPVGGKVLDPFVGSGTTVDTALRLGRHAVGIDMSSMYLQQVQQFLTKSGATSIQEESFFTALRDEPKSWEQWPGNKMNFRKPGTRQSPEKSHGAE